MMKAAKRLDAVQEYYFSKKLREVRALSAQGKPIINMGIGSPDLLPPQEVIAAMQQGAQGKYTHQWYLASVPNICSFFTIIAEFLLS